MGDIKKKYLMNNLVRDYQKLTQDVMMYEDDLKERDKKWHEIGGIKNPDFEKDKKKEFINNKITDLKVQRNKIWSYLTLQFKKDTQIREGNLNLLNELTSQINSIKYDIHKEKIKGNPNKENIDTRVREFEIINYKNNKNKEIIYLHVIGFVCFLLCSCIMILTLIKRIQMKIMYMGCGTILLLFFIYLIKMVYVDNINQSIRDSNNKDFNKPSQEEISKMTKNLDYDTNKCNGGGGEEMEHRH